MSFELIGKRVWVAGHNGMLGSSLLRNLSKLGVEVLTVSRQDLDLTDQAKTKQWIKSNKPEVIFLAAAKVGGILANNTYASSFLYDNLMIEANIIEAAANNSIEKLLFIGSSCIYPKVTELPIKESSLLTGPLEPTNEFYALAKIAGLKLCQAYKKEFGMNFISAMPTNLYGPGDSFDLEKGHVVPSLFYKIYLAKTNGLDRVIVWGSGKPKRDIIHVDDCSEALIRIMEDYDDLEPINIGSGSEISISQIAHDIAKALEWEGEFVFDNSKPDGTMTKILDVSKLNKLGWKPKIDFSKGIKSLYQWFIENQNLARGIKT